MSEQTMVLDIVESLVQHGINHQEGHDHFTLTFHQHISCAQHPQCIENAKEMLDCRKHIGEDGNAMLQKMRDTKQHEENMKKMYEGLKKRLGLGVQGDCDDAARQGGGGQTDSEDAGEVGWL